MASKSLNRVMLIGNVAREPELRYTPQGSAVVNFTLATNRTWKTDSGEIREEADFHRLVAWNKLAEICSQLITRGRKVFVEGRLQTRNYLGADNAQHYITEIVIDDMILLDPRPAGVAARPAAGARGGDTGAAAAPAPVVSATGQAAGPVAPADDLAGDEGKKTRKAKKSAPASTQGAAAEGEKSAETVGEEPAAGEAGGEGKEDVNAEDIPF